MNYSLFCSAAREREETADVLTDCGKIRKFLIKILLLMAEERATIRIYLLDEFRELPRGGSRRDDCLRGDRMNKVYDVLIIGGGVVGSAIAREMARNKLSIGVDVYKRQPSSSTTTRCSSPTISKR